jgi:hypothetical protein
VKGLSRLLLWDFPRASWQYDILVILILAFIFLTPRDIFHDQPRAASVEILPAEQGMSLFWIAPELLDGVPSQEARIAKASALVNQRYKRRQTIIHVEEIRDEEMDITGYMAYARP